MQATISFVQIATLIDRYWGGGPDNAFSAAGKIILSAAAIQSRDPGSLSRYTHFPTTFTWAVIDKFSAHPDWMRATSELHELVNADPMKDAEVNSALQASIESLWDLNDESIDLEKLWWKLTGDDDDGLKQTFATGLERL